MSIQRLGPAIPAHRPRRGAPLAAPRGTDADPGYTVCQSMPTSFPAVSMDQKSERVWLPEIQLGRE